jgi:hypothetical protein
MVVPRPLSFLGFLVNAQRRLLLRFSNLIRRKAKATRAPTAAKVISVGLNDMLTVRLAAVIVSQIRMADGDLPASLMVP